MNKKFLLAASLGLCGASGLCALLSSVFGEEVVPTAGAAVEAAKSEPEVGPMKADFRPLSETTPPAPGAGAIIYPDGSSYPALNGVTAPIKLLWSSDRPYSPVVGKMYDGEMNHMEWYVHADGSYSTTAMLQNRRGGPLVPTGIVQAKLDPLPLSMMVPRDRNK